MDRTTFLDRVARRAGEDRTRTRAAHEARAVMELVDEATRGGLTDKLRKALDDELARTLFPDGSHAAVSAPGAPAAPPDARRRPGRPAPAGRRLAPRGSPPASAAVTARTTSGGISSRRRCPSGPSPPAAAGDGAPGPTPAG
ncbi:DUF2267 domain-containing protein [Streptomyces sp. bgisy153]|uniref:DUF2267 domain-containing protein n=1 Tax=Streptomyces sp. bgisy153 TaxID=3413793 RepID=UPI003D73CAAD